MKLCATSIIVALIICLAACQRTANTKQASAANQKHFEFKGKVIEISDREKKSAKIAHETIRTPGLSGGGGRARQLTGPQ